MLNTHREYVVDNNGNRKAVLVPLHEWEQIMAALEELDDIRAYDEAKAQPSNPVPFAQAIEELQRGVVR